MSEMMVPHHNEAIEKSYQMLMLDRMTQAVNEKNVVIYKERRVYIK